MIIRMNYTVEYDTDNSEFWGEYEEWQNDYPQSLASLIEFATDRFISRERINELDQTGAQLSVVASEHGIVLYQETEMVN